MLLRFRLLRLALAPVGAILIGTGIFCDRDTEPGQANGNQSTDSVSDSTDDPIQLRGKCKQEENLGGFYLLNDIDSLAGQNRWSIDGYVYDNVIPSSIGLIANQEGACQILTTPDPICDPPCQPDQACTLEGTCIPYPIKMDLGTVSVSGLAMDIALEPMSETSPQYHADWSTVPYELEQQIELTTSEEGFVGKRQLYGFGIEPLEVTDTQWRVTKGEPLSINWIATTLDVPTQIDLFLNIDLHGASMARIACVFPDTGSAVIPKGILEALFEIGAGIPQGILKRFTADSVQVDDERCFNFGVVSKREVLTIIE
ncbi:MAG: hypothetical protein QNJ97_16030 [Myxococcota bacterium]|nr:hypothetical protein [Myxococcota bacterium]